MKITGTKGKKRIHNVLYALEFNQNVNSLDAIIDMMYERYFNL